MGVRGGRKSDWSCRRLISARLITVKLGQESNPLNASPANQEISQPRPAQEGGHGGSAAESGDGPSDRSRTSGGGSPEKGKSGQKYSS